MFAKRTLKFYFEPIINAFAVEFMRTLQSLYHRTSFQSIYANSTILYISFSFFIFKGSIWIYDSCNFLWWELVLIFIIFFIILRLLFWIRIIFIVILFFNIIIFTITIVIILIEKFILISILLKLVRSLIIEILMILSLIWILSKSVSLEVHLYICSIKVEWRNLVHHILNIAK